MEATVLADRYELGRMLGTGVDSTTCVYEGWDRVLSRPVAIKILSDVNGDAPSLAERFRADVGIAGRLEHHNLVRAYDAGTDGEVCYIVMELIEGRSLRQRLEEGPLTPAQAIAVGVAVSSALAVAHANRLVHRGIGPKDIMLLPDGQVKVLNIGITGGATGLRAGTDGIDQLNGHHDEQADRDRDDGNRADLYALGCCVYEMITGTAPFAGGLPAPGGGNTPAETPPPMSGDASGELSGDVPDVPEVLEGIVMRALAADPADRYQTADELRDAFELARTAVFGLTPPGGLPKTAELLATSAAVPVPVPMPAVPAVAGAVPASPGARWAGALVRGLGGWLQPLRGGLTGTRLDAFAGRLATSLTSRGPGVAVGVPVLTVVLLAATLWGAAGVMRLPEVAAVYQALPMEWIGGPGLWLDDTVVQSQPAGTPAAKGASKPPVEQAPGGPPTAGGRRMVVQGMIGVDGDRARFLLGALGLRVTSYTVVACPARDDGNVVRQSPPGGTTVLEGSTVELGVCRAKQPAGTRPTAGTPPGKPPRPPSPPTTRPPSGTTAPPAPPTTRPPTPTTAPPAPTTTQPPAPTTTQPPTTEPPPPPTTEPPPPPTTAAEPTTTAAQPADPPADPP